MQTTKTHYLILSGLLASLLCNAAPSPKFTPEDLYDVLSRELTSQLPKSLAEPCKRAAGIISGNPDCNLAQDANSLRTHLLAAFQQSPDLDWNSHTNVLTASAEHVSQSLFGGGSPVVASDKLAKALAAALGHHLKQINRDIVAGESGRIAQ